MGGSATPTGGGADRRAVMASLEGAGSAVFMASTAPALTCSSSGTVSPAWGGEGGRGAAVWYGGPAAMATAAS